MMKYHNGKEESVSNSHEQLPEDNPSNKTIAYVQAIAAIPPKLLLNDQVLL